MIKNIDTLEETNIYRLLSSIIVPRPIAWISTKSSTGILNLAPFSYFTQLSSSPATIIVSIGLKEDGSPKDTLKNLREGKKCSIVIATPDDVKLVEKSASALKYNESEYKTFDIDTKEILANYPSVPKNTKIALFGVYLKEVELDNSKTTPVIIEIQSVYVDDKLYKDPIAKTDPLARVGSEYYALGEILVKE